MPLRSLLVCLLWIVTAACAGTRPAVGAGGGPVADGMSAAEIEALFEARQDSARMRFTPADVEFVQGMIGHHAQALIMAALVPERSASSSIRILAARIINAQEDEIATMEQWLRDRDQAVPVVHIHGMTLHIDGEEHHHHMPGMLTPEQMSRLEAARGAEFDRLFLSLMIQHHQGAVTMVHHLFTQDGAAQDTELFRLASDIQVDQITEINRMESMLGGYDRLIPAPGG